MFKKILVAIDGSPHSCRATDVAANLAQHYNASLCLLHAFPHTSDLLGAPNNDLLITSRTMIGMALLEAAQAQANQVLYLVDTQLIEGPPAPAIVRVAKDEQFDLIVMGSRGHNQFSDLLLGSVSHNVIRNASCPVLVVHQTKQTEGHPLSSKEIYA